MILPLLLIAMPLICGLVIACLKSYPARKAAVFASAILLASLSIYCVATSWSDLPLRLSIDAEWIGWAMQGGELVMTAIIAALSLKYRKRLGFLLALVMAGLGIFFETSYAGTVPIQANIVIDQLTVIMLLIIGVVGSLICIYASGYMHTYQEENPGVKDRRRYFFFVLFLFLSGMFGLALSNDIAWMYFFWEITTFCSFLLIGYTRTKEAVDNSFRAVVLNMLGGVAFMLALIFLARDAGVLELDRLAEAKPGLLVLPLAMLCIAGFTKTAMLPFSSWLLGAMVAPTPVSALLHSSTMVKAGVYLFLRIAPYLAGSLSGSLTAFVGGITFLLGAFLAISQRNSKRVLAYSTISNLGLIVACAGIGTYQTIWVAIFLLIFHAVSKSLMFLTVGTVSNGIGSLEIEDMTGLIIKMPRIAIMMIAGICGMFVAPFGMLISKWAAMEAFINLNTIMSPIMIILIAYGSAATIFFWTKWMGTIMRERNPHASKGLFENHVSPAEFISEFILTLLTILTCFLFPVISTQAVEPYLISVYHLSFGLSLNNVIIMVMMIGMILVIPTVLILIPRRHRSIIGTAYMGGCSTTEDLAFDNSLGQSKHVHVKSYYLEKFFGEKRLFPAGVVISTILIMVLAGASAL